MPEFTLGQRVRVKAEAKTAYDELWWRERDDLGRRVRKSEPGLWEEWGWECVHRPNQGSHVKCLWRRPFPDPQLGVVIGRTYRATGRYLDGIDEESVLCEDKRHTLYQVAFSLHCQYRPLVLPEDVEELAGLSVGVAA